jgi:hypothetical protein
MADERRPLIDVGLCLVTVAVGAVCIGHFAWRQWLPWDDGTMAQAAERALRGQLPHRDFNEPYTGGLTWLHAAAFRLLGTSLGTLRTTLFMFAVGSVPVWYYVARRFTAPLEAGVLTLTWITWSVPNYPAPLPSWYNLFFAMGAVAALLRSLEKRTMRWILLSGVCVGLSIAAKIIGVYLGAAIVSFLVYDAAFLNDEQGPTRLPGHSGWPAILVVGLVALAVGPLLLTFSAADPGSLNLAVTLGLPPALITGGIIAATGLRVRQGWRPRLARFQPLVFLACGIGGVLMLFALPYFLSHSTETLVRGVLLRAQHRLDVRTARGTGPDLLWLGFSLPLVYVLVRRFPALKARWHTVVVLAGVATIADIAAANRLPGLLIWLSVRMLMLPLAVAVTWHVWGLSRSARWPSERTRQLVLVASVAAWCSLVQFPFAYPTYFAYAAPLVIATAISLSEVTHAIPRAFRLVALCAYGVFGLVVRSRIYPERSVNSEPVRELRISRGGIRVAASDADTYEQLVTLLKTHARGGFTLATPDAPEVYFLSGLMNPTPTFFEVFDDRPADAAEFLKQIDDHAITAIVINRHPQFSLPVSPDLRDSLIRRFRQGTSVGELDVRWRPE